MHQPDARQVATAVRSYWGVENQLHWVLDVTISEDESRVRRDHVPVNFNTQRQFASNLVRRKSTRASLKRKRFKASLDDGIRAKAVFGL